MNFSLSTIWRIGWKQHDTRLQEGNLGRAEPSRWRTRFILLISQVVREQKEGWLERAGVINFLTGVEGGKKRGVGVATEPIVLFIFFPPPLQEAKLYPNLLVYIF